MVMRRPVALTAIGIITSLVFAWPGLGRLV